MNIFVCCVAYVLAVQNCVCSENVENTPSPNCCDAVQELCDAVIRDGKKDDLAKLWCIAYSSNVSPSVMYKATGALLRRYTCDNEIGKALLLTQFDGNKLVDNYNVYIISDALNILHNDLSVFDIKCRKSIEQQLAVNGLYDVA